MEEINCGQSPATTSIRLKRTLVSGSTSRAAPWESRAETSGTKYARSQRQFLWDSMIVVSPQKVLTEVVLSLSLLLLKLERDTANGTSLNPLHQVGGESSNLVSKTLGRNDGNLIADLLVGVAVGLKWIDRSN